ncbi:Vacuolar protein sorting-associated protein 54 [Fulvia fulva]|nr:Vacuolar protein sorting-associated protein 54 [Fulvia fulva]WPV16602.1 Vacuolar protein sorting-associated protein 54 [Fulvia fulva]WPV30906.1 Vacuolar protein sorting-associated protein 54 [Fulvia fulva]
MSSPSSPFSIDASQSPASPNSPRSAFPLPPQDLASRNPSGRYRPRRGSSASTLSISSIGGSLDLQGRRGSTVRETSQNAISTLIQPPIVRTGLLPHTQATAAASGYRAPTTRDIPPVTLTNVPHVPPESFRDYLNRIGPLFESFQRGRAEPEQSQWLKKDKELEKTDRFQEALERRISKDTSAPPTPTIARQGSVSAISPVETPGQPRRKSSAQYRRNRNEPTPLSTIPNVYFDEDFHLENPRTFDVVSERAEIVRPPPGAHTTTEKAPNGTTLPPRKALATNAILQEKLSWYMDTVEVHLINSISTASSGFFAALGSLKELQTEAEESVAKIQSLREDLRRLDKEVAVSGLEVAAKRRRRENVRKLGTATAQVQNVVETVRKADELVDEGAYDEASDQMDRVGRLICGQQESGQDDQELIDLRRLKALQGLDSGLQELQLRIGTGFASRFTTILMNDLRRHMEKVASSDTLKRWSRQRGVAPTYMETSDDFRKELLTALKGLERAGHTEPASAAYREAVNREMKSIIRKFLPSSSDDDADSMVSTSTRGGTRLSQQEKSSILARNLRALEPEDAEKLLVGVYSSVGEALRRVSTQTKVLLDITSSMDPPELKSSSRPSTSDGQRPDGAPPPPPKATVQEKLSQALDMSSLLGVAVDTAQTQITRVLKVRNEQSIRLPKEMFLRYFTLNRLFADECEAVSGRGGNVLKGIINAQISGFVQVLGTSETERIAKLLDSDNWNATDFTEQQNVILQRILAAMSSDPAEWSKGAAPLWEEPQVGPHANGTGTTNGTETSTTNGTAAKSQTKPAYIDDTRFVLVASVSSLLPTIDTFLSLTSVLPSMTPQISTSLLEVLRMFDSRSRQLILGAGATRSAGLKNITTKHLALASQALSFIIALVPYMRECVRRHIAGGQGGVLAEFDKLKRVYQEHQSSLHDKLVDIMTSRSQTHVKAMLAINFDTATNADDKASPYMETLTKETSTLNRVLSKHLGEIDVSMIMRQIFSSYKGQWTKAFGEVDVKSDKGEKLLLKDAEAFESRLGKIEGFGDIGKEVVGVVKAKVSDDADEEDKKKVGMNGSEEKAEMMFDAEAANDDEDEAAEGKDEKK